MILMICLHLAVAVRAQTVTLKGKNISLLYLFREIKRQTGYLFLYDNDILQKAKKINIDVSKVSLSQALDLCFKDQPIQYRIVNKTILLKLKELEPPPPPDESPPELWILKGKVIDEDSVPLPGVTVMVKGSSLVTQTDGEGEFFFKSIHPDAELLLSNVGYAGQVEPVSGRHRITTVLSKSFKKLNEVIIVGYGTQRKVNVTGAVSVVPADALGTKHSGQVSAALQGLAPGVTITTTTGKPGGDVGIIRIRGVGTLSDAGSNPLVLIDGVEGSINIEPDLIESISILKDAASASIYGSRAANGVILVTTKRAKSDRFSIDYNGYAGWQRATNLPHMVNAIDHMLMTNEAYVNVGRAPLYPEELIRQYQTEGPANRDLYPDTDWQKEVLTGSGFQQNHFLSITGGNAKLRFLTSLGYFDQKGIIENSGFKRYTVRNNMDLLFSKMLSMRFDIQMMNTNTIEPGSGTEGVFHWMNRIPANQIGINSNGTWGEAWNGNNPIAMSKDGGFRKNNTPSVLLNASVSFQPVEWLKAELTYAPKYQESIDKQFVKAVQTFKPDGTLLYTIPARTTLTESTGRSLYNTLRTTITFNKKFGNHTVKMLAGGSREDYHNDLVSAFRDDFVLPGYPVLNGGSGGNQQATGSSTEWALQSLFGRINYDYRQKYLLELNGRNDGSSRFASGHKYSFFPSVSAGWRITEEPFMEPLGKIVTELKLRGSWGQLGNQNISNYAFASYLNIDTYTLSGQIVNTAALNNMANPNISWETTAMSDVGIDMTLFSQLSITADYYVRKTRDILEQLSIPLIVGLNAPQQNVGRVKNKGWEIGLTWKSEKNKNFKYDLACNLSDVRNQVIDLHGVFKNELTTNMEGYPINSIYGLQAEGYFQSEEEVNKHATQFGVVKPGDIKYVDQNNDGLINDQDNVVIGSTIPRYTYSATVNLAWKGFDMSLFVQGVGKADGFLYRQGIMPFYTGGTVQEQHKDHWTPGNRNARFPRLAFGASNNEKVSGFWLKNAAYLRLKNLQFGYTIPKWLVRKAHVKNLRVYLSGQNVFTIDQFWNGYDVETPVGIGDSYPQVKLFCFGINANF